MTRGAAGSAIAAPAPEDDPDLAAVVEAWPELPEALRPASWRWSRPPREKRLRAIACKDRVPSARAIAFSRPLAHDPIDVCVVEFELVILCDERRSTFFPDQR